MHELQMRRLSEENKALKARVNQLSITKDFLRGRIKLLNFTPVYQASQCY